MTNLRNFKIVLIVVLISTVLWVGLVIFLNLASSELRTELLRSENVYQFLSKGMLDEVKITVEEEDLEVEGAASVDLLEPIEPFFTMTGYESILEKIKVELLVPPKEFHDLQSDAVMREVD